MKLDTDAFLVLMLLFSAVLVSITGHEVAVFTWVFVLVIIVIRLVRFWRGKL